MESYISKPAIKWDVGLCIESEMHVSLLRRTIFKIATTILLHELNIYSQKLFDLAYKFETDNDEHTRISIIRAERDPVKNMAENQKGDAMKNAIENQEKEERVRQMVGSPGASTTSSYSPGPSTTPSYSPGPSTPPSYSLGPSRNAKCANCKLLIGKLLVLEATLEMFMHPEKHTIDSNTLLHELYNNIQKFSLE
nr:ulp1 protease family, C-terminal catalytic domain-containing protein [Tanacetum cinerariifolium]